MVRPFANEAHNKILDQLFSRQEIVYLLSKFGCMFSVDESVVEDRFCQKEWNRGR